jgi:tRNA uridine 5-carboxymethylaminomethyl modification enzyme
LARQEAEINDMAANEQIQLSALIDYRAISGLSNEMVERLDASMHENLAAASRIRVITTAELADILVHAKRAKIAVAEAA